MNNNENLIVKPKGNKGEMFDWATCEEKLPFINLSDGISQVCVDLRNVLFVARVPISVVKVQFRSSPLGFDFPETDQKYFDKLCDLWRKVNNAGNA